MIISKTSVSFMAIALDILPSNWICSSVKKVTPMCTTVQVFHSSLRFDTLNGRVYLAVFWFSGSLCNSHRVPKPMSVDNSPLRSMNSRLLILASMIRTPQ